MKQDKIVKMKLTNALEWEGVSYQPGDIVSMPFRTSQKIIGKIVNERKNAIKSRKDADKLAEAFVEELDNAINNTEQQDEE